MEKEQERFETKTAQLEESIAHFDAFRKVQAAVQVQAPPVPGEAPSAAVQADIIRQNSLSIAQQMLLHMTPLGSGDPSAQAQAYQGVQQLIQNLVVAMTPPTLIQQSDPPLQANPAPLTPQVASHSAPTAASPMTAQGGVASTPPRVPTPPRMPGRWQRKRATKRWWPGWKLRSGHYRKNGSRPWSHTQGRSTLSSSSRCGRRCSRIATENTWHV